MSDVEAVPADLNSMSSLDLEKALRNLRLNETSKLRVFEERQAAYRNLAAKRAALSDDGDRRALKNDVVDATIALDNAEKDLRRHREVLNAVAQRLGEVQRLEEAEERRIEHESNEQAYIDATFTLVQAAEEIDAAVGRLSEAFGAYKVAMQIYTDCLRKREASFEVSDFIGMTGLERVRVSIRERIIREGFPITTSQVDSGVQISTIADIIRSYHLIGRTIEQTKGAAE